MERVQATKAVGDAAFRRREYAAAAGAYGRAIDESEAARVPDLVHVLYCNRSAARLALGQHQEALADAQAALSVDGGMVKAWFRSARALQALGSRPAALQAASRALELEPGSREVRQLLQELRADDADGSGAPSQASEGQPRQQQPAGRQRPGAASGGSGQPQLPDGLPWPQLNAARRGLLLQLLPAQLVEGSAYLPAPDGVSANLLLLLHGLGDRPKAFTALASRMQLPQTACLALSGPLELPETDGGRAWFQAFDERWELIQPRAGEARRARSLAGAVSLVRRRLLPALLAAGGWRPEQIQVLGYDQGGTVALELARECRGAERLGGVVAVSAALLEETLPAGGGAAGGDGGRSGGGGGGGAGTDVLVTHGARDQVLPRDVVDRSVAALRAAGCAVELHAVPGKAHGMIGSEAEMRACMAFWARRLRARPPGEAGGDGGEGVVEVPRAAAAEVLRGASAAGMR